MRILTTLASLVGLAMLASCSTAMAADQDEPLVYQGPGAGDTASKDTASKDTGSKDKGSKDKGSKDTRSRDKASKDKASKDKASTAEPAVEAANPIPMEGTPQALPDRDPKLFPCVECHDEPEDFNMRVRKLRNAHEKVEIKHGGRERWCYDCHNQRDKDRLRFAGGEVTAFESSFLLCGQCHGSKLRDWYGGVHGKRIGSWNGEKTYFLCVNCHNPHQPKFEPLKPKPRPKRPSEIR